MKFDYLAGWLDCGQLHASLVDDDSLALPTRTRKWDIRFRSEREFETLPAPMGVHLLAIETSALRLLRERQTGLDRGESAGAEIKPVALLAVESIHHRCSASTRSSPLAFLVRCGLWSFGVSRDFELGSMMQRPSGG